MRRNALGAETGLQIDKALKEDVYGIAHRQPGSGLLGGRLHARRAAAGLHVAPGLRRSLQYPVLADTTQAVTAAYGVLAPDGSAYRATFVIDPDGNVRHVSVSDQSVGRSPDETLRVLQALRTGALCPVSWKKGEPTLVAA